MYAVILITEILGFIINKGVISIERKIVHWKENDNYIIRTKQ